MACGWFGIQTWIGGQSIYQLLTAAIGACAEHISYSGYLMLVFAMAPLPLLGINAIQLACFLTFWGVQVSKGRDCAGAPLTSNGASVQEWYFARLNW